MILGFENKDTLKQQINSWVKTYPDIYSSEVKTQSVGDWFLISFDDWDMNHKENAKLLQKTFEGNLEEGKVSFDSKELCPDNEWDRSSLWTLIPWEEENPKKDCYYVLIEKEYLDKVIKECFRNNVFRIDYQVFEDKYLLQLYFAPFYLLETIRVDYDGKILWRDTAENFFPWRKRHPLAEYWCKDKSIRIFVDGDIKTVESLEFKNIIPEIKWDINKFKQSPFLKSSDNLNLEINIKLVKNNAYNLPSPCLWFFDETKQEGLEEWITNLSLEHRDQYLIFAAETPIKGYYLKPRAGISENLVTPPPSSQKFYRMYDNEDVYGPYGTKITPKLPYKDFCKIFPIPSGKSMVLSDISEDSDISQFFIEDTMYESLSSIVSYVLAKNSENIQRMKKNVKFNDPKIELFNWEVHGKPPVSKSTNKKDNKNVEEVKDSTNSQQEETSNSNGKVDFLIQQLDDVVEESDSLENQRRLEIHTQILEDPTSPHLGNWEELGDIEIESNNFKEALNCYEMALFFSTGQEEYETIRTKITECREKQLGSSLETSLERVFNITSPDSLIPEDLDMLGFHLLGNGDSFTEEQKTFYERIFSVGLESLMKEMNLLRVFNFCIAYMKWVDDDSFFFLKMKDVVLLNLYEKGIYEGSELPLFLSSNSFTEDFDGQATARYSTHLTNTLVGESKQDLQTRLFYNLIFAVGSAWRNNATTTQNILENSKEILKSTEDKVHAAAIAYYEDRCEKIFSNDSSPDYGKEAQEAENELSQAERYKFNKLLTGSLILNSDRNRENNQIIFTDFHNLKNEPNSALVTLIPEKIDRLINDTGSPRERQSYKMKQAFGVVIELLPRLGDKFTFETLTTIFNQYQNLVSIEHKSSVLGKMLSLAYHYNRSDWVDRLYQEFNTLLENIEAGRLKALTELISPLVSHFPKMLPKRECLEIANVISGKVENNFESCCIRIYLAKIYDALNETDLAVTELQQVLEAYFSTVIEDKQQQVQLFLFLINEIQESTHNIRMWVGDEILKHFESIEDHLSCNDHFSYTKVLAMEYLVTVDRREEEMSQEFRNYLLEFETTWKTKFFEVVQETEVELN